VGSRGCAIHRGEPGVRGRLSAFGTTLLELALDAHPQLKSMDEQRFVQDALDDLSPRAPTIRTPARCIAEVLDRVRARYWERVAKKVKLAPGERLVDKNPLNILRLPVIRRVFPNARILLAVRHPCDVILSCYMQQFRRPISRCCAKHRVARAGFPPHVRLLVRQSALLGPAVHELKYEISCATSSRARARRRFPRASLGRRACCDPRSARRPRATSARRVMRR
jgi:hypothetical protein